MTVDLFRQKYGYEIEGMWLPRVTAVTSSVARMYFLSDTSSADWGNRVHSHIERLLKGEEVEPDKKIAPSLQAFYSWQAQHSFQVKEIEHIEARVFDEEYGYAGTMDVAGEVDGTFGIVDLKTGSSIRKEYALQTAAYMAAHNKHAKVQCQTRWILRIDQYEQCEGCMAKKREREGRTRIAGGVPYCNHWWGMTKGEIEFKEFPSFQEDFEAFLAAKEVWEWHNKQWLKQIPNYPGRVSQRILIA